MESGKPSNRSCNLTILTDRKEKIHRGKAWRALRDLLRKYSTAVYIFRSKTLKIYDYDYFYDIILNCKKQDVLNIVSNKGYKTFWIPKKNGLRTIAYLEKNSILYIFQKNLLKKVFFNEPIPVCAKGFVENESYRSFLASHVGSQYFLRVDIHDFFGSIKKDMIENMLTSIVLISNIDKKSEVISIISEIVTLNDCLPQGACTSPSISNLCFVPIDQRITKYCQKLGIRYTRYADDLLFSSDNFNFSEKKWFLRTIRKILRTQNLKLNYSKIKFGKAGFSFFIS